MSSGFRPLLDTMVAVFLIATLGAVSWLDRIAPKVMTKEKELPPTTPEVVTKPPLMRLGVIRGTFDDIGRLLDTLGPGYRFEKITEEKLRDPSVSTQFDAIFLTCDDHSKAPQGPPLGPALREFVTRGGTLYASDLRFEDLEAAFPEFIDAKSVTQGVKQESLRASVSDPGLRDVLGPELPLHFDLDGWRPAAFGGVGVTVYLEGSVPTTAGVTINAPLMVKFNCGKGSVLFTSFHNTKQNSADEAKLLKFLVLSTVTAQVETGLVESLEKGGFTRVATSLIQADPGKPSKTRTFNHKKPGKLIFSLGFEPRGATLKLIVNGPNGFSREKEGSSTFSLDVPDAAKGEWTYTAMAENVPYENFPFTLGVGAELPRDERAIASNTPSVKPPPRSGVVGGSVKFRAIPTQAGVGVPDKPMRIAVTKPHFDDMGKLLESLGTGYQFDVVDLDDLRNPRLLDRYDILFLTCDVYPKSWAVGDATGATNREGVVLSAINMTYVEQASGSLRRFVSNGGTLYASDLSYNLVIQALPHRAAWHVNKAAFEEFTAAQEAWLEVMAPNAHVGNVEETLRQAGLSKSLEGNLRGLAARIEWADMADVRPPTFLKNPVFEFRPIIDSEFRSTDVESDTNAIVRALISRSRAIRESHSKLSRNAQERAARRLPALYRTVNELRTKITPERGGSGTKQTLTAQVVDPGWWEQLGETITLDFNAEDWTPGNFLGSDQSVLLRGEYLATGGGTEEAPLLVRFKEGKGTVIFTSFHNEKQNSKQEELLLRNLVFTTVTAKAEEAVATTMLSGGFPPSGRNLQSHSMGQPSVTRAYQPKKPGPLRFALTFSGQGAAMKFALMAPNGQTFEQETNGTMIVEATGAPMGEWRYTVTAVRVPYENFPYSVSVGESQARP